MVTKMMGTRTLAIGCVAAAASMGALAGCGGQDSDGGGTASGGDKERITVALDNGAGANVPWNQALERGVRDEARKLGNVEIVANLDGKGDIQTEANNVNTIIGQKPDAVIMYTGYGAQATRLVDRLDRAGIPVVALHYRVGSNADVRDPEYVYPKLQAQVLVDEVKAGRLAGELVQKVVPGGTEVGVVTATPGFVEVDQRMQGFKEALGTDSSYRIVASQPGNLSPQDSEKACAGMLGSRPRIGAIYIQADIMVPGCSKAVKAAGSKAKIVGMGGSKQGIATMQAGDMAATICYRPYDEGRAAVRLLSETLSGSGEGERGKSVVLDTPKVEATSTDSCDPQYDN